jgi:hypothetical protein
MNSSLIKRLNKIFNDFLLKHTNEDVQKIWSQSNYQSSLKSLFNKNKDVNCPKRSKSSYLYFCTDKRDFVLKKLGSGTKTTDVTKELGKLWNLLKQESPKDFEHYQKLANDDKERYLQLIKDYVPPVLTSENKEKPKNTKSAYVFFCETFRNEVKDFLQKDGLNVKNTEIVKELSLRWNKAKQDGCISKFEELSKNFKNCKDKEETSIVKDITQVDDVKKVVKKKKGNKNIDDVKVFKKGTTKNVDDIKVDAKKVGKKGTKKVDDVKVDSKKVVKKGIKKLDDVKLDDVKVDDKKMSLYQAFCSKRRDELKSLYPNSKPLEITKILSKEWNDLKSK